MPDCPYASQSMEHRLANVEDVTEASKGIVWQGKHDDDAVILEEEAAGRDHVVQ